MTTRASGSRAVWLVVVAACTKTPVALSNDAAATSAVNPSSTAGGPNQAKPPGSAPTPALRRGVVRVNARSQGKVRNVWIDHGVAWCDDGGTKQMGVDGTVHRVEHGACDAREEENWGACAEPDGGPIFEVRRPNLGPDDFVDLRGGRSIIVPGHLASCVADERLMVLGGDLTVVLIDLHSEARVPLSDQDGAKYVALSSEWLAWTGYFQSEIHLRRRDELVAHMLVFPADGGPPSGASLAVEDADFVDSRHGWGWSDRCFQHVKALEVGWAWAACAAGLKLADLDPKARASLVFNQGLVAKELDERSVAKELLEKSLHMRPANDPGRREVMKQLEAVEP